MRLSVDIDDVVEDDGRVERNWRVLVFDKIYPEDFDGKRIYRRLRKRKLASSHILSFLSGMVLLFVAVLLPLLIITAPEVDADACGDYRYLLPNAETFVSDWKANWKLLQQWEGNILGAGGCAWMLLTVLHLPLTPSMTYNPISCSGNGQNDGGISILYTFTDEYGNESSLTVDIDVISLDQSDLIEPANGSILRELVMLLLTTTWLLILTLTNSFYNFDKPENAPKTHSL